MEHFNSLSFYKSGPDNKQHTYQSFKVFLAFLHKITSANFQVVKNMVGGKGI